MDYLLKKYIDNYILNRINYKKKYDEQTDTFYFLKTIPLSIIERSSVVEEDYECLFEYLKANDVYVVGDSPAIYSDFDNYIYVKKESTLKLSKAISKDELNNMFKEYKACQDEDEKIFLRNKIVEKNLKLVKKVVNKYHNIDKSIKREEIESYGFEGLIKAVENYCIDKGEFSTFAFSYIDGFIKNSFAANRYLKRSFFDRYLNCKKNLEAKLGYQIKRYEEFDYLDDIFDIYTNKLSNKINLRNKKKSEAKNKMYLSELLSIDDFYLVEEDFTDKKIDDIFLETVHENIIKCIEELPESSKMAIYHLFDLDEEKKEKYDSLISSCGYDTDYIRKAKQRAFNILRKQDCLKKDLEEFGISVSLKKKVKTKNKNLE